MSETAKPKIIEELLKLTKGNPEKYFDQLSDYSVEDLRKLVEICNAL